MKDNKPLEDPLADRMKFTEGANNSYKMELIHCRESDSGTYIARATNGFENATCTAQLIVEQCMNEFSSTFHIFYKKLFMHFSVSRKAQRDV